MSNSPAVFSSETEADRVALRLVAAGDAVAFVVPCAGGFYVSLSFVDGAVTRWSQYGSLSFRPQAVFVRAV